MKDKILRLLGLCKRASRLTLGFDETAAAINKGTVKLLALASDLSVKSEKEIVRLAKDKNIKTVRLEATMDELWYALGKRAGILSVTDQGLAGKIAAISGCARQNEEDNSV